MNKNNLPIKESYKILNIGKCKDTDGKLKRWLFDVSVAGEYHCYFYLNSFNITPFPHFYAEEKCAYDMKTDEPIDNHFYIGETKANICMAIAEYIKTDKDLSEMKEWAEKYIENYNCIRSAIEQSNFKENQSIILPNGKEVSFTLCSQSMDAIRSFDDIEYYLSYDDVFSGGDDLVKLACDATNMSSIEKFLDDNKEHLASFYQDKNIADLFETPYDLLTDNEKEDLNFFSDWYKDIYHHRPRSTDNAVQQYLDSKNDQDKSDIDEIEI